MLLAGIKLDPRLKISGMTERVMLNSLRDRYGFLFWLRWIAGFAGSFVASAIAWTIILKSIFGPIESEELILTWTVSVFGTWFMLVIPFMRKKEQVWKRLNDDQERAVDAWLSGMGFFIGTYVASALLWTLALKQRIIPNVTGLDPVWAKSVFTTWLLLWIPLLVWMYRSADRIFKTANERQGRAPSFRVQWIAPEKRLLPQPLAEKLGKKKPTLPGGHLVRARMKNGEILEHLFVLNAKEVVGAYDLKRVDFDASQLEDLDVMDSSKLPEYQESLWVRFNISS